MSYDYVMCQIRNRNCIRRFWYLIIGHTISYEMKVRGSVELRTRSVPQGAGEARAAGPALLAAPSLREHTSVSCPIIEQAESCGVRLVVNGRDPAGVPLLADA